MKLRVLLPFRIFAEIEDVERIVAESASGSFGILPQRLDCTAALVPGILIYRQRGGPECYLAVDEGILVKCGNEVRISVRHAIAGEELAGLRAAVAEQFAALGEEERQMRATLARLESGFVRRFSEYRRG